MERNVCFISEASKLAGLGREREQSPVQRLTLSTDSQWARDLTDLLLVKGGATCRNNTFSSESS